MIDVSSLELGGLFVFKLMIGIVLDVKARALRSMTQSLEILRLKDAPKKKGLTAVSYLKEALVLLQNCDAIPTNTMELINDIMTSADCDEFTEYMKSIYFASKRKKILLASFTCYLNTAESEYRTLYRARKWTKS